MASMDRDILLGHMDLHIHHDRLVFEGSDIGLVEVANVTCNTTIATGSVKRCYNEMGYNEIMDITSKA